MSYDARAGELGLELPGPFPPHDPLDAVVVFNGSARTSGCLPRNADGVLHATGVLGRDVATDVGVECARWCALNALSLLRAELGSLDRVERVLTVTGFVACTGDFDEQPTVVDGASRLLYDLFGAAGRHTRSAIGVAALPRRGPVEIEVTVALRD
jgi:enamine deaminase RidA (YjgF/YER057c/UK114 family)